jgi:hypothetical protein
MKDKINVTVIIPIHSCKDENFGNYLKNAITSIASNDVLPEKVLMVLPADSDDILSEISKLNIDELLFELNVERINNTGSSDFASQINFGVSKVETEYFSFLEFDDEYSNLWFHNVAAYMKEYPNVGIFLPIISDVSATGVYLGYTNEVAWAYEFTDKHGYIDHETMKDYPNFNPDGMVMKVAEFKRIGGYKKNFRLTFNLEFLLRSCDQGLPVFVIPKIGYKHVNMRPNSLFWNYKYADDKLAPEETDFWMEAAQKEYYYLDDRPIQYIPNKTTETI